MKDDDDIFVSDPIGNGYLIEICTDSLTGNDNRPDKKMKVISDLLTEPKNFLFMISDKEMEKDSLTLVKPDFKK